MKKWNVAIIGLGFVGKLHYDALRRLPNVHVRTIVVHKAQDIPLVKENYDADVVTDCWQEAVADPQIQVIHNCTPNALHDEINLAAIGAGKHLYAEKPMSLTTAGAEEVLAAARAAQCEEFVSRLPEGYQSNIGENGCILSGGERQRISIARAILKDAPVVILDEATASMDAENETLVQQALSELLQGKTVLVIAHRMRTIANADKVVVLDHGQVVEMGTPTELLEENGLFQRLVAAQVGHL